MSAAPRTSRETTSDLLADRAYAALRDRIVSLRIAPGAPINEDALGRELDMGRTPVREAIKRLALENLVSVFPRRGTFASEINITDLAHISDVRQQLEGHAAYRAAQRLTPSGRQELEALLARIDAPGEASRDELMELDAEIHRFVHRRTANPYLEETLARYFNLSLRIWYLVLDRLPQLTERVREHRALLEAIRDGDAERARAIAADHVGTFATEIRSVL
jgi:DNA-binding GntR family transcriptional regulator